MPGCRLSDQEQVLVFHRYMYLAKFVFWILPQESYPVALVVVVWRLSFSCCGQVAKLGLGFQLLVNRQRGVDYKLLNPC